MHRNNDVRLQQADHLSRLGSVQTAAAAYRHQGNMDRAKTFNFRLRGYPINRAQVKDVDPVIFNQIQGIFWFIRVTFVTIGRKPSNKNVANFVFARAVDLIEITFNRGSIVVPGAV
jgi:hypothetical protein